MRTRNNFFTAIFPAFLLAALLFSGCPAATDDGNRDTGVSFPAPTGLLAELSGNSVTVTWNPVRDAAAYEFYFAQREDDSAAATYYQDTEDPVFTMDSLGRGVVHYFWVKAKKADGETSPFSAPASAVIPVEAPSGIMVGKDTTSLHVTWEPADGASSYEVWVADSALESRARLYTVTEGTYTEITDRAENTTYYVRLKSKYDGGASSFSERVSGTTGEPGNPAIPFIYGTAQLDGGRVDLYWNAAENATFYEIYYGTTLSEMNSADPVRAYGTTHRLTGLTDGVTYYLRIRARAGSKASGYTESVTAVPGGRLPESLEGIFLSRYPYDRPYYMDGHRIGKVRDMREQFPFNVAGRPSAIGPSTGRYTPSSDPYPRPGPFGGSMGPVMPSGYTLNNERDQYVLYIGMSMNAMLFGPVRAVVYHTATSNGINTQIWDTVCEYGDGLATTPAHSYFVMRFYTNDLADDRGFYVFGLMQVSMDNFNGWDLSPAALYSTSKNFYDAGVAYPAIKVGSLSGESPLFNPLLIEKGPAARAISALSAQGLTFPGDPYSGGWWQRWTSRNAIVTEMGEEAADAIVSAFWNEVRW
jgi:hypothetical protein